MSMNRTSEYEKPCVVGLCGRSCLDLCSLYNNTTIVLCGLENVAV